MDGFQDRYNVWLQHIKKYARSYNISVESLIVLLDDFNNFKKIFEWNEMGKFIFKYFYENK